MQSEPDELGFQSDYHRRDDHRDHHDDDGRAIVWRPNHIMLPLAVKAAAAVKKWAPQFGRLGDPDWRLTGNRAAR